MSKVLKYTLQVLLYAVFAAFVGYLSVYPSYHYASAEMAQIKLSLSHATDLVKPCTQLTPEEIARLAAAGQAIEACERERLPLSLELEIDGRVIYRTVAPPSGLWSDGPASVYERFEIEAGEHVITTRLRDTARSGGWDYEHTETVMLEPGRYFTVRFRPETGGFRYR